MSPPDRKRSPSSPEEWLAHARSDLKLAKLGLEHRDVLYHQICFHAQQAVEKALKAVLLHHKIDFPLTHDIDELIDIFEKSGITVPSDCMDSGFLTPYAVETRYPGYWVEITDSDVGEAIKTSEKVVKWAEEKIIKTK
jgi:HEPN domain-containing protein